ncbi:MAG TPA: ATP-binding protein [Blastocatellia bacterium]|nr:ATP-binding protein [Blastocatellia bacterium]
MAFKLARQLPPPQGNVADRKKRLSHDRRILIMAVMTGLPAVIVALVLLWNGDHEERTRWTLTVLILGCWWGFAFALVERVVRPLQTLSNLLAALWEGDYSIRARGASDDDPLGEVMLEVNALGELLREQRLDALEATTLLRTVMAEIDVAIFAFDGGQRLRWLNRSAERLLSRPAERLLLRTAQELGLADCLKDDTPGTVQMSFPGGVGRWALRRSTFREHGLPHHLLMLSDLTRALREEERQAWQRLVRVLGHELNNSLTPIKSIAGSLVSLISRENLPSDWQDDMQRGLTVISTRAEALNRFMGSYSRLARLPQPKLAPVDITALVKRVAGLETRLGVTVVPGPPVVIQADGDQLEQLLINLQRNAVDASLETGGGVRVGWGKANGQFNLWVDDDGPGLSNTSNLFVPFFTTKPEGSGIGLVLCRQIAEGHGGTLTLENKQNGRGCEARLRLPL